MDKIRLLSLVSIFLLSSSSIADEVNFQCIYLGEKDGDNLFCYITPTSPKLEDLDPITQQYIKDNPDSKDEFLKPPKDSSFEQKTRELIAKQIEFQAFEVFCPDSEQNKKCQSNNAPKEFPEVNFSLMNNIAMESVGSLDPEYALESGDIMEDEADPSDCINGGWTGRWIGDNCQVNAPTCSSGQVTCNPLFYGNDVCVPAEFLGHTQCSKRHTPQIISKLIFSENKMDQFNDEFSNLQYICMEGTTDEKAQTECNDITEWRNLIGENLIKLENTSLSSNPPELPLAETSSSQEDKIISDDPSIIDSNYNDPNTKEASFTLNDNRVISLVARPTKKKIPTRENEYHFEVTFTEGDKEHQYIMPESELTILIKGRPINLTLGKKITFDDGIFPMELESKRIDPIKRYLSQCLTTIKSFFQNEIDLKDEKWQRFLKLQADLTLHRLGWAYLKTDNEQLPLEDKIIALLKQKFANENDDARAKFDALMTINKKSRTFLPMALNLVSDVLYHQVDKQDIKKEQPFLLSSSDITMLEILAENEQKMVNEEQEIVNEIRDHRFYEDHQNQQSVLNFTTLVNSAYIHSENRIRGTSNKKKKLNHIEKYLTSISNTFKQDLREIVGKECVDEPNLVCQLGIERESILDKFMNDFSQINLGVVEGLMQRSDSQNYLKHGHLWLKTTK